MRSKEFGLKHILKIVGIPVGMLGGYLYYFYIGCSSGGCPITSNPYISVVYGGIMGYLVFDMFNKKDKNNKEKITND